MKKFENVKCELCQSDSSAILYSSEQYADSSLGKILINIVMCNKCGFIYQNPQLTYEALAHHYKANSSGDVYREITEDTVYGNIMKERKAFLSDFIHCNENFIIGDIGGGAGDFLSSLEVPKFVNKYLIEPSNAIDKNKDSEIIKIKSYIEDLPPDTPQFDLIICISVLEHVKRPSQVLKTIYRKLKDDGGIFIEVPNSLNPEENLAEYFSYEHVNHFTHESLNMILYKNGFYPVKIETNTSKGAIRLFAKKRNLNYTSQNIVSFFKKYKNQKNIFTENIVERVRNAIAMERVEKLSIYGAGDHTRFLLAHLDFIIEKTEYFIDSDPRKWGKKFYNKKIISPEEIKEKGIKNILISSQRFENDIHQTIKKISQEINIIALYKN